MERPRLTPAERIANMVQRCLYLDFCRHQRGRTMFAPVQVYLGPLANPADPSPHTQSATLPALAAYNLPGILDQVPESRRYDLLVARMDVGQTPPLRNVAAFPGPKVLLLEDCVEGEVWLDPLADYVDVSGFDRVVGNTTLHVLRYLAARGVRGLRWSPGIEGTLDPRPLSKSRRLEWASEGGPGDPALVEFARQHGADFLPRPKAGLYRDDVRMESLVCLYSNRYGEIGHYAHKVLDSGSVLVMVESAATRLWRDHVGALESFVPVRSHADLEQALAVHASGQGDLGARLGGYVRESRRLMGSTRWVPELLESLETGDDSCSPALALPAGFDPDLFRDLYTVLRNAPPPDAGSAPDLSAAFRERFDELAADGQALLGRAEFDELLSAGAGPARPASVIVVGEPERASARQPFSERGCYVRQAGSAGRVGVYRKVETRQPIRRNSVLLVGDASANHLSPKFRAIGETAPELRFDTLNMVRIAAGGVGYELSDEDSLFERNLRLQPGETWEQWLGANAWEYDLFHLVALFNTDVVSAVLGLPAEVRLLVSFVGSDLYQIADPRTYPLYHAVTHRAERITVHGQEMKSALLAKFGQDLAPRVRTALWGVDGEQLERLARLQAEYDDRARERWRERQGVAADTLVVTVGYSGAERVNHLAAVEGLSGLPEELRRRCLFVFPMSYGGPLEHTLRATRALERSGLAFRVLSEYQSDDAIAELMINADYHVNVPTTDAFNNFMVESLAAGTVVLNGAWLPYRQLDALGIRHTWIDSCGEIAAALGALVAQQAHRDPRLGENRALLERHVTYRALAATWADLYRELL